MPCPPPGDLPDPGIKSAFLTSSALVGGFFTTSTTWEAMSWESASESERDCSISLVSGGTTWNKAASNPELSSKENEKQIFAATIQDFVTQNNLTKLVNIIIF